MATVGREKLFANPTHEYRGRAFWSWNGDLKQDVLDRQADILKQMGFGGYFLHSRVGLATEYLGDEWFGLINHSADYAVEQGMEPWIYDEDRWPSGAAAGMVAREPGYRQQFMQMELHTDDTSWKARVHDGSVFAVFAVDLDESQIYSHYRQLVEEDVLALGETAVVFKHRFATCTAGYNGTCGVDAMNPVAVNRFLEITYDAYEEKCGGRLGKEIPGTFTDEPSRGGAFVDFAENRFDMVPYTPGLFDKFEKCFGYSLLDRLPELFFRASEGELSRTTHDYYELTCQLFVDGYMKPVHKWCQEHNLIFSGHLLQEDALSMQAAMMGSLMRGYEHMDWPGIDLLEDGGTSREYGICHWIGKQVDSVARQCNKEKVTAELYACTGWNADFETYKNIGDWLAFYGVSARVPHLSWYTMKGQNKRDYPASIGEQSPWWPQFHYVEDYFSRINVALAGAKARARLLVVNPVESVWARSYSGAYDWLRGADSQIKRLEQEYVDVFEALQGGRIDFDYGDEDMMARLGSIRDGKLRVGACGYDRALVAGMDTIRSSTLSLLREFAAAGGEVVFAGDAPAYVDAVPSTEAALFAQGCTRVPFSRVDIAAACADPFAVQVSAANGVEVPNVRARVFDAPDGSRMVFVLNLDRGVDHCGLAFDLGEGCHVERWDPRDGSVSVAAFAKADGHVMVTCDLERGGERLFRVTDEDCELPTSVEPELGKLLPMPERMSYKLAERNVCVLDMVSMADAEDAWPEVEVLKADRRLRDKLGLVYRGGTMMQPWYRRKNAPESAPLDVVRLTYRIVAKTVPTGVRLALEDLEHVRSVTVNGTVLSLESKGSWVDQCFSELDVPDGSLCAGVNSIVVEMEYWRTSGIEAVYLLGHFGVEVFGNSAQLCDLPEALAFGDVVKQGLAFYSGAIDYELPGMPAGEVAVSVPDFEGGLVQLVGADGAEETVAFPPFVGTVRGLRSVRVVVTRRNTFGPLHEKVKPSGYGPGCWMCEGEKWNVDYSLYPEGLLSAPEVREVERT